MDKKQELQALNEQLDHLSFQCKLIDKLLNDIEQFNGPKFIRVFLLWDECRNVDVSPFITRGKLKEHLDEMMGRCADINRQTLAVYYDTH